MTNKEYLNRAFEIEKRIAIKTRRLAILQDQVTSATANLSGMPHSNVARSKIEELTVRVVELEKSLEEDNDLIVKVRKEIQDAIKATANENYISILDMRYLQYMTWEEIIVQTNYSRSHVFRIHGEGLSLIHQH